MMQRIVSYVLLCVLWLAGLGSDFAAPPETGPSDWPDVPFARNVASGEIIYLGMEKAEAEAITGEPLGELRQGKNMYDYEDVILGFRDDRVMYIQIPSYAEPLWAANGVVTAGMPTDQTLEALGMPFEVGSDSYDLLYFEDGTRAQRDCNTDPEGRNDYRWALFITAGSETIRRLQMGDKQYLLTMQ